MKRTSLKSDPEKARAFQQRGRKPLRRSQWKRVHPRRLGWAWARQTVLERDTECRARLLLPHECTVRVDHVHHVKPRGRGGSDDPANLLGVCENGHAAIHLHPDQAHAVGLLIHSWKPETP